MYWNGVIITLLLLLPYKANAIAILEPLIDTDVIIGDTVTLSGTVTDNPNIPVSWRSQLEKTDKWEVLTYGAFIFSAKSDIRKRYKIQVIGETYNLIISNVESGDAGVFEIGYITGGTFFPLDSNVLSVLIPPNAGFPVCEASPAGNEYLVGQILTLKCQTEGGTPEPDIVWLRNDVELERISLNNSLSREVRLTEFDNGALFECQLDGPAVTETLSCEISPTVAKPMVTLGPSVVVIDEGRDAVFNCTGQGVLSPTFSWSFPTEIIQSSRFKIENGATRLTILKTTMSDNNAVVRCEMNSFGKVVAGRSATLLIRPKTTTMQPTTVATTVRTTIALTTTQPTTVFPTTTPLNVIVTTIQPPTDLVKTSQTNRATTIRIRPMTTSSKPTNKATTSFKTTNSITETPTITAYTSSPKNIYITTVDSISSSPSVSADGGVTQEKGDNGRKNRQHLGLIFAAATAVLIVLTIVIFSAFCLVVCKTREKKDSFNVSNNASSLAGTGGGSPYNNGIFRNTSEYHDDELTGTISSQRESQASATESATGGTQQHPTYPENLYTLPAKLGKTTKIYHPASSSQPDFSTFRLVDESLRNNKALSSNSLGRRPKPVPAPKPPRSYGDYENVSRGNLNDNVMESNFSEIAVVAHEDTPLQSAVAPDPIETSPIYENGTDIRNAALVNSSSPEIPKQPSPDVSPTSSSINYTYEDVLKIADSFLNDLEQFS
ncbi:uncharacterized protein [Antedon mediterranea]|uniref:uncharacterized protein n=1 Tax=Antedon mediterranea TaxID=105859 RepID=UPI003AF59E53